MNRRSLAVFGAASVAGIAVANAEEKREMQRVMTLSGRGEVKARPDLAMVTIGVVTQAATAREALTANNEAMTKLLAALKAAAIEPKDIQTSNFGVNPRYDYGQNNDRPPRIVGYDVANNVTVTVRNLDKVGGVLDAMVSLGSNQINGVAFSIDSPQRLEDEARKLAVADAQRKAKLYAEAAGVTLGPLIAIAEGGGYRPPAPVYAKQMRAEAADSVPVAEGEQTISIEAQLTWELK